MIEFFTFSEANRIVITFILGICALTQTLAIVLNFYRRSLTAPRAFESLFEISILFEILIFSFLHGQVVNGYINGFVVAAGYENIRIAVFIMIMILVLVVCIFTRRIAPPFRACLSVVFCCCLDFFSNQKHQNLYNQRHCNKYKNLCIFCYACNRYFTHRRIIL